ncbi:MAG: UDP-N-acetylmuramate dehydrogenase [Lachnospiraceae bacterium]
MEKIIQELEAVLEKSQIFENEWMKDHTTFQVGGSADAVVFPPLEKLCAVRNICMRYDIPYTIIGNGSNLLVSDEGIPGVVIVLAEQAGELYCEGDTITAHAGALLSKTADLALQSNLTGMEFASGIPGSVGGAAVMNAGAYGGEMKDIILAVKVLTLEGHIRFLSRQELDFSYRHSCIPENGYIVLEVVFQLRAGNHDEIEACMKDLSERRHSRQPLEYGSAGSTFKRPEGHFAGKLIMDSGLGGYRIGGAQVAEKHCGFIINTGDASAKDIYDLIHFVQKTVFEKFEVMLEPEVRMIGRF